MARGLGIEIGDDVRPVFMKKWTSANARAQYGNLRDMPLDARLSWEDFLNVHDQVPIQFDAALLSSDEAVVAHIAHEMYEVNTLRDIFAERGTLTVRDLRQLIAPGIRNNLHDEAWDVADLAVALMRDGQ